MFFGEHRELLGPFREGRRDVLERVYRAYVRPVEGLLRALAARGAHDLGQPSAIADLLQEVFVRAFSDAARRAYDGQRDYGPYLFAVARHCFIDALRARGREVLQPLDDLPTSPDAVPEPASSWEPEVLAALNRYLAELAPPLRAVYEQRFVLGRSQEEASAALGLSRRGLRTAEERLRRGLRKALARQGLAPVRPSAPPAGEAPLAMARYGLGGTRRS